MSSLPLSDYSYKSETTLRMVLQKYFSGRHIYVHFTDFFVRLGVRSGKKLWYVDMPKPEGLMLPPLKLAMKRLGAKVDGVPDMEIRGE